MGPLPGLHRTEFNGDEWRDVLRSPLSVGCVRVLLAMRRRQQLPSLARAFLIREQQTTADFDVYQWLSRLRTVRRW